jgi:aryl-alcohol dehydrogenase-like predicted oxidoreductase
VLRSHALGLTLGLTVAWTGSGGGKCEERMGRWLRARKIARSDVVIISKGGCEGQNKLWAATCGDAVALQADLDASLHRLGVDYLDCYLLHRDDPSTPVEKVVGLMDSLVRSGQINAWGVSNWQLPRLAAALDYSRRWGKAAPVADSPQNSLAEPSRAVWPNTSFLPAEQRPLWNEITRGEVAMLGWESLAKGFMCGRWSRADGDALEELELGESNAADWRDMQLRRAYCDGPLNFDRRDRAIELARSKGVSLPEMALGYVLSQSASSFALVGTTSVHHWHENVKAALPGNPVNTLSATEMAYMETGHVELEVNVEVGHFRALVSWLVGN